MNEFLNNMKVLLIGNTYGAKIELTEQGEIRIWEISAIMGGRLTLACGSYDKEVVETYITKWLL